MFKKKKKKKKILINTVHAAYTVSTASLTMEVEAVAQAIRLTDSRAEKQTT